MREPWQLLTISIMVGRNAHARVTIAMIAILMHDGPAYARVKLVLLQSTGSQGS